MKDVKRAWAFLDGQHMHLDLTCGHLVAIPRPKIPAMVHYFPPKRVRMASPPDCDHGLAPGACPVIGCRHDASDHAISRCATCGGQTWTNRHGFNICQQGHTTDAFHPPPRPTSVPAHTSFYTGELEYTP